MARFSVKIAKSDGRSIIELADAEAGTAAKIACDLGFNCCSFVKKLPDGPGEYIYSSPEFLAAGRGVTTATWHYAGLSTMDQRAELRP